MNKLELSSTVVKKANAMTDINNHSECVLYLARIAQLPTETRLAEAVVDLQDQIGHMPMSLNTIRDYISRRVRTELQATYYNTHELD